MRDDPDLHRRLLQTIDDMLGGRGRLEASDVADRMGKDPDLIGEWCLKLSEDEILSTAGNRTSDGPYILIFEIMREGYEHLDRLERERAWWPLLTRERLIEWGDFLRAINPLVGWTIAGIEFVYIVWTWLY